MRRSKKKDIIKEIYHSLGEYVPLSIYQIKIRLKDKYSWDGIKNNIDILVELGIVEEVNNNYRKIIDIDNAKNIIKVYDDKINNLERYVDVLEERLFELRFRGCEN